MKENMKSRRGVALAEAVIALVVIGIISVATLTIIFSSVQVENKTIVAMDVRNQAENAIECFRFAKGNEETFIACLKRTTADSESDFIETGVDTHIYALDKGGYEIVITVMVDDAGEMTGFEFVAAYENKIEDPIYDFDFPKPSNEGGSEQ